MALTDKLTAIGNAIREKIGKTDLIPLAEMPDKVGEVYDSGKVEGEKAMWDAITANNTRTVWLGAFRYYDCEYLRPPYVIAPTQGAIQNLFSDNKSLKKVERKHFDFSNYVPLQTLTTSAWYQTFINCSALEEVEDLGMQAGGYSYTFSGCTSLGKIAVMRVQEDTQFSRTFDRCNELQNITIEGTIGQNGFNVSAAKTLSRDSILSILNACNKANAGVTVTLPSTCTTAKVNTSSLLSGGTDAELTAAWNTAKNNGYTIAYA